MKREFVMTEYFENSWKDMHLNNEDLRGLEDELMRDPAMGNVIQGTGGFRKMRFAFSGRGKSGSMRVIYLDIPEAEILYLMLAYPKSEKDTLTGAERNELKEIAENIKRNLKNRKKGRK